MKFKIFFLGIGIFGGIFLLLQGTKYIDRAYSDSENSTTVKVDPQIRIVAPLTAEAWAVFDADTGEILDGKKVDSVEPIASLSKLFTAYIVLESAMRNDPFEIIASDIETEGTSGGLQVGVVTTPYKLLFPLLLESSNDAAVASYRAVGKLSFDTILENLFEKANLTKTRITEPTGLSAKNVSTAVELATFFVHLREQHPHVLDVTQLYTYVGEEGGYTNNNPGRSFDSFMGGKQGYTDEAKKTFLGSFKTNSGEIGVVLLGSDSLDADLRAIIREL